MTTATAFSLARRLRAGPRRSSRNSSAARAFPQSFSMGNTDGQLGRELPGPLAGFARLHKPRRQGRFPPSSKSLSRSRALRRRTLDPCPSN
jgi:hypothetical protein